MKILITAGPTREFFDTVRFISNPSSGKMGYALAAAAKQRGHDVLLVSGPVALPEPKGIETIHFPKAERAKLEAKAAGVWEAWAKRSGKYDKAKQALADYMKIRDEVIAQYPNGVVK